MSLDHSPYEEALRAVVSLLGALPGPAMLIGGVAVIAHGHIRTTDDIDATVSGALVTAECVIDLAATHDIHPRIDDPLAFARRTQMLLLKHRPTGIEFDLSLAWIPFEEEALARRMTVQFRGVEVPVCDPEDLIVYKIVAARPLDVEDARQLAMRHRLNLDRERITRTVAGFDEILDDGRSRLQLWRDTERAAFPAS
jgi:hypothetical protein